VGRSSYSALHHDGVSQLLTQPVSNLPRHLLSNAIPAWACSALIHPELMASRAMTSTFFPFGNGRWRLRLSHLADSHLPTVLLHLTGKPVIHPAQPRCRAWAFIAEMVAVPGGDFRASHPLAAVRFERNRSEEQSHCGEADS
jgi:hypothetical protein